MQFEGWVIVQFCLSTLTVRTLEVIFHPKQEAFIKQLSSYEIATPIRLNEFGENFPHTQHFRRRKRSLDSDVWGSKVLYRISAYGQNFLFNLTADSGFIAQSFTVTHIGSPQYNDSALDEDFHILSHCFYRGHVNGEHQHTAVFSLCTGLVGSFKTKESEYFIEPLIRANGSEYENEHSKPHLIYRHESLQQYSQGEASQLCTASDNQVEKNTVQLKAYKSVTEDIHSVQKSQSSGNFMKFYSKMNVTTYQHTRQKRFLSYPRFVEVMVTADNKMVRHHGRNLQHYILTLMAIVAAIYKDASIGNLIHITIVKLIVIHNEKEGPSINFNAATTLHNFCVWQQTQNTRDDSNPSHHDTAVLITREDICRATNKCDTLGLAELGTVCDSYRSCSISEENGLSAAFTIAHELGHVFNMPHDDSPKCKEAGVKHQYHVMAPILNYDTKPWTWSKCSRKYITEFLDTGYGECLLDEPSAKIFELSPQLPGQLYNANRQCELMFGPGSQVCPYLKQCKRLWCTSTEGIHKGCRTQHLPLADGTECGPGMHCLHGSCVNKEVELRPVDGDWGPWGQYSSCSRSCGGGIKIAARNCNKPEPKNGGKYCVGRRLKFRSCNTNSCPKGKKDFREEQCSEFDGKHFNINGLPPNTRWLPKYSGVLMKDRCKLFCRVAGTTVYYQLKDRVSDGTPCGPETNDICVQGLCRQAGCDHVLNSKARRDKCGICGGDNSSCKTVAGTFNSVQYGYNVVVRIPEGATSIDIRQHSYSGRPDDDNYLALSDSQGDFVLNGNFVVSMFRRELNLHGASIEYSGSGNAIERINCSGRIQEELIVQVLSVGSLYSPDVRYSFNIPVEDRGVDLFTWDPDGSWQECSKICQGIRKRKVICIRKNDRLVVSDQRCEHLPRPPAITEQCNTECQLRWRVGSKSECSAQCGPGYRTIDIKCMKYSFTKGWSEQLDNKFCSDQSKPPFRESCHGDCLLTTWRYTSWSQCSRSCGRGTRAREAYCINNLGRRVADKECNQSQKIGTQNCNDITCPEWIATEWSECLVTCGKGMKHRQVVCRLKDELLSNNACNLNSKPESVAPCQLPECASWQTGPWGPCTVTCGQGYQMRAVLCLAGDRDAALEDRNCNAATRPRDTQDCEMSACQVQYKETTTLLPVIQQGLMTHWKYGSWTPCSVSCGKGTRARYVSCRDASGGVADESYCVHLPRPQESSSCFSSCGQWHAGDWSSCSVTCGQGRVTRQVICTNYHNHIDSDHCSPEERPAEEQECSMPPCLPSYRRSNSEIGNEYSPPVPTVDSPNSHVYHKPQENHNYWNNPSKRESQWRTGPWGACSSTCAGGFQRRAVVCQDKDGRMTNFCSEGTKPAESKHCESGPCPHWNYGSWGECTQSCGDGIRTRMVICELPSGQRLNEQNCDILEKPPDTEQCNMQVCPAGVTWHRGAWKSCSVTCGRGIKHRDIYCTDMDLKVVDDQYCQHVQKPQTHKPCRVGRCPSWKANRWSECSVTCGTGIQQRKVFCRLRGIGQINDAMCDSSSHPSKTQYCELSSCAHYVWIVEEWEECSAVCGEGKRQRQVICVNQNKEPVNDNYCVSSLRPPPAEKCMTAPCEYIWILGDWSQCSATCGLGYQQRMIYCTEVHSAHTHYSYDLPSASYQECPLPHPPDTQKCFVTDCPSAATWKVGQWSKCSVTCGIGTIRRRVKCMDAEGLSSTLCLPHEKPKNTMSCQKKDCEISGSCRDIQKRKGIRKDGEYLLNIRGVEIQIHCSGMQSDSPKEYVTLPKGEAENYSEVYSLRLENPYDCPFNGSRRRDCTCRSDYLAAGHTVFRKIRFDPSTIQIMTDDLSFAHTIFGRAVPFATAGDCYSAAKCPQGQFSISLTGTGLRISDSTKWSAVGNYATADIRRSQDGTKVYGRCGGYCGKCVPQASTRLSVEVY
ncbi:A disintegrin and metalloproteinase with thrombospondin motifs 20 [Protopterus annectens]|uniref:A disintegrin and metalloproteinase with thrombospondin motifs 20 n=1 Tax=Protopterus annectens TaxID=7888 RepID=UPI001CF99A22|nr:A disintegrin and metalloproteinase with thrombospondin motifs 20 [Protopterus annectens]